MVGAGEVAARKIELLCKAGAIVTVVAIEISSQVIELQKQYVLKINTKIFEEDDLSGMTLAVAATNLLDININVANAAKLRNVPINVVDNPDLCSFIFPAIIDRSPLIAAISSSAASPVLSRLLRSKIETAIPPAFGLLAAFAKKFRPFVKQHIKEPAQRRIFWENVLQGSIAELVMAGRLEDAECQFHQLLSNEKTHQLPGEVYLIGAGPGDPDLLTIRALRLIQQADVIVYDRLVSEEIMVLTRRDAEKIYVGKQRNLHSLPQESINALLLKLASAGKRVARLKGGDPFIFGRGGEEIETLMLQGINFQVVPGITAASGCASYAGIPLTHRDHAQSCIFVTGHLKDGSIDLNWQQLSAPNQTVVIYMGLVGLENICEKLIAHGSPANLPIAIIQQGTTLHQQVITGTLADLPQQVKQANLKAPTLIIIGSVVSLHERLAWFKPQQGR